MSTKKLTKEQEIEKEYKKIQDIFSNKDSQFLSLNDELFHRAAFMAITLTEMEKIINKEGTVRQGTNGNGFTTYSEHPAQKSYNTMMKNYSGVMSKLNSFIDSSNKPIGEDEFDDF